MQRRALLVIGVFVVGCGSGALDVRSVRPYALTENSFSFNGLIANGLLSNGLRMNGLRMNGLRMNGLEVDSLSFNDLDSEESLKVMTYLVECAAPAGETTTVTVGGNPTPFYGALGLAPEWDTDGIADPDSEERVTSCLMARTNALGISVEISLEGAGLTRDDPGELDLALPEAVYWGNIFMAPIELAAYPARVFDRDEGAWFTQNGRSCALNSTNCQFDIGDIGVWPINGIRVWDLSLPPDTNARNTHSAN
jgi:hypothetical protein